MPKISKGLEIYIIAHGLSKFLLDSSEPLVNFDTILCCEVMFSQQWVVFEKFIPLQKNFNFDVVQLF